MARKIAEIQQQILDNIAADDVLGPLLTSTSKRAIHRLFAFIIATAIALHEQLLDIFKTEVEGIAASAVPATPAWLQKKIFEFQYSSDIPQVIQVVDPLSPPYYPVVDESLRIITRCSVSPTQGGRVQIKVAKGDPPEELTADEKTALAAYVQPPNGIGIAGVEYVIVSSPSDKLRIQADIYYEGNYSQTIQASVKDAISAFLAAIPFNGVVKVSDLEKAIRNVPGVSDILIYNLQARPDSTPIGSATYLVQDRKTLSRLWNTSAGYIVSETTAGNTLDDTLTFIAD